MTAAFATGGHATPIVTGRATSRACHPEVSRAAGDAHRPIATPADTIMRAAGAIATGEA